MTGKEVAELRRKLGNASYPVPYEEIVRLVPDLEERVEGASIGNPGPRQDGLLSIERSTYRLNKWWVLALEELRYSDRKMVKQAEVRSR